MMEASVSNSAQPFWARLIAGPFKAYSNRAFRCTALANLDRRCYEEAVLAFWYGYKPCELAVRLLLSGLEPSLDCVASGMWYRC